MKRTPEEILNLIERIRVDISTKKKNSMYHGKLFVASAGNVLFKDSFITKNGLNKYITAVIFRSLGERRNYIANRTPSGTTWRLLKTNHGSDLDSTSIPKDLVVMNFQFDKESFKSDNQMSESLIKKLFRKSLITEASVSSAQLNQLEKELDTLFAGVGVDIDFTSHFFDRVNDARNGEDITIDELRYIFKNVYGKYKDVLKKYGNGFAGVFKNNPTNINIPFTLQWDRHNNEIDLISKTIMRTHQFHSQEPFLPVNDANPVQVKQTQQKDKYQAVTLQGGDVDGKKVKYYELSNRFETWDGKELNFDSIENHLPDEILSKALELNESLKITKG